MAVAAKSQLPSSQSGYGLQFMGGQAAGYAAADAFQVLLVHLQDHKNTTSIFFHSIRKLSMIMIIVDVVIGLLYLKLLNSSRIGGDIRHFHL